MNIVGIKKKSVQLCFSALMLGVMLFPVQAAEPIPVPVLKPYNKVKFVHVASSKPKVSVNYLSKDEEDKSFIDKSKTVGFKSMTLQMVSLFSTEKKYPNNYVPLSSSQSKIYSKIFEQQALGNIKQADDLITKITDKRLMGYVLYQRYTSKSYDPDYKELSVWLDKYSNYSNAGKIYDLALSKKHTAPSSKLLKPNKSRVLAQVNEPVIYHPKRHVTKTKRNASENNQVKSLSRKVSLLTRKGKAKEALAVFKSDVRRKYMDKVEHDIIQSNIASAFLYNGEIDSAYKLAEQSSDRSGLYVPNAAWIAGLALWQKGDFVNAARYFGKVGKSSYASGWQKSAGYYWQARCYKRIGDKSKLLYSLKQAAENPYTFYGLLALQSLGKKSKFDWQTPEYSDHEEKLILSSEAGKRVFALVAAGQYSLAESELLRFPYKNNKALQRAVLAYASHVNLPSLSLRLGNMLKNKNGDYYNSAIYPLSPWAPEDGYKVDSTLINAVIRQESRFNQSAKSYSGARGLMQIMPKTAQYVAKIKNYSNDLNSAKLSQPEFNLKLGQDYLEYLLNGRYVKGDVVSLLVAYNAGPGNLLKWRKRIGTKDTLLFIEMLPVQETRDYVERVLSNYWIYRDRAGLEQPSLVSLSKGQTPKYAHIMQSSYKLAAN